MKASKQFFNEDLKPVPEIEICKYKDRRYAKSDYNGIEIIYCKEDDYINATKMCQNARSIYKVNKRFDNYIRLKEWKEAVKVFNKLYNNENKNPLLTSEEWHKIEPYYEIKGDDTEKRGINGTYVNRKLINFVAMWCSIEYSFKVSEIMNNVDKIRHLENQSLKETIKKLEEEVKNKGTGRESIEGEIEIKELTKQEKEDNYYHLYARPFAYVKPSEDSHHFKVYNAETVFNIFKYYTRYNVIDNVKYVEGHKWEGSLSNIIKALTAIKENTLDLKRKLPEITKTLLENIRNIKYEVTRNASCFEIWCALKYNMAPFKLSGANSLGLSHKDIGVDLFDIENKISGQCKMYTRSLDTRPLQTTYVAVCQWLNSQDTEWKHKLFVLPSTYIQPAVVKICEENKIEIIHTDYNDKEQYKLLKGIVPETATETNDSKTTETTTDEIDDSKTTNSKITTERTNETTDSKTTNDEYENVKSFIDFNKENLQTTQLREEWQSLTIKNLRSVYIKYTKQMNKPQVSATTFRNEILKHGSLVTKKRNDMQFTVFILNDKYLGNTSPWFQFVKENEQLFYLAEYLGNKDITETDKIVNDFNKWCENNGINHKTTKRQFTLLTSKYLQIKNISNRSGQGTNNYRFYILTDSYKIENIKQYSQDVMHTFILENRDELIKTPKIRYNDLMEKFQKWAINKFGYENNIKITFDKEYEKEGILTIGRDFTGRYYTFL